MRNQTHLIVEFSKLASNYQKLKSIAPKNETIFMVKANAYGHGLCEITEFSFKNLGIKEFGVASIGEAIELRKNVVKENFEIYVFSDLEFKFKKCEEAYIDLRITPVISNFFDLDFYLNNKNFRHLPLFLKINTGMNRLGFRVDELEEVIKKLKSKNVKEIHHFCSHFASSVYSVDTYPKTKDQFDCFLKAKKLFLDNNFIIKNSSISNSGGIEQKFGLTETHIRPGLMLYGPSCLENMESSWEGESISRFSTYILHKFMIKKNETFGYSDSVIDADGVMTILPLGYGDGVSRNYKGVKINYNGLVGEVVGRVNMDMTYVFFKGASLDKIKVGEPILVWGHDPKDVEMIAATAKTVPYEIYCQISPRIPKIYKI